MKPTPPAFDPAEVPESNATSYPEALRAPNQNRYNRRLGNHAGLKNFGVNLTRIVPGGQSSYRHAHSRQDEFVYVLEGEVVLETDAGEQLPGPACARRLPRDKDIVDLLRRLDGSAGLSRGDLIFDDVITYPEVELHAKYIDGKYVYSHKDGKAY